MNHFLALVGTILVLVAIFGGFKGCPGKLERAASTTADVATCIYNDVKKSVSDYVEKCEGCQARDSKTPQKAKK